MKRKSPAPRSAHFAIRFAQRPPVQIIPAGDDPQNPSTKLLIHRRVLETLSGSFKQALEITTFIQTPEFQTDTIYDFFEWAYHGDYEVSRPVSFVDYWTKKKYCCGVPAGHAELISFAADWEISELEDLARTRLHCWLRDAAKANQDQLASFIKFGHENDVDAGAWDEVMKFVAKLAADEQRDMIDSCVDSVIEDTPRAAMELQEAITSHFQSNCEIQKKQVSSQARGVSSSTTHFC